MSTMEQMVEAGARAFANVSEGTDAFWQSYSEEMRSALLAALPMLGEELGDAAWRASKSGLTHNQIAEEVRSRLSEIMEGK